MTLSNSIMYDIRLKKLAENIVNYGVRCQKGEKVLVEAIGIDYQFVNLVIDAVYDAGGIPFIRILDRRVLRELINNGNDEAFKFFAKHVGDLMQDVDCYIAIGGGDNTLEMSDVENEKMQAYSRLFSKPVHSDIRVKQKKWLVMRYPTGAMAQQAGMSTEAFENYFFEVCGLDYQKMEKQVKPLMELINRTDKVHIKAKDTDLTFSVKGIGSVACVGHRNLPDGEVYTAPVKNSVNGYITYNAPSLRNGVKFENVRLEFVDGKIVKATSNYTDLCNKIFDTDEGARYVGEFSFGLNPYIHTPSGETLFDEKISGSIHFTPGDSYTLADNGNHSAVHWDLVQIQTPEYGGGEIWFDDVLVRKDGRFVLEELFGLNPENLK